MGFEREKVEAALKKSLNDVNAAANMLLNDTSRVWFPLTIIHTILDRFLLSFSFYPFEQQRKDFDALSACRNRGGCLTWMNLINTLRKYAKSVTSVTRVASRLRADYGAGGEGLVRQGQGAAPEGGQCTRSPHAHYSSRWSLW